MNFKEFLRLNEMPQAINDLENDDDDVVRKCKRFYDDYDSSDIPDGGDYYNTFSIYKNKGHHGMVLLITNKDDEFIGYVKFSPSYQLKNGIIIQTTEIVSEEQGQGIATDAYKYLLEHFDHIISDSQLTDGSTALYKKLGKKYKPQIFVKGNVHSKEKSEQKDELKDIDFTDDKAMKGYENRNDVSFVLSKK